MMQDSFNPYRVPDAGAALPGSMPPLPDEALWRDGNELVCRRDAVLPPHCIKCDARLREDERKAHTFYWHTPWLLLLVLVSVLVYAIVAVIVRKRSAHLLGLCQAHRRRRAGFLSLMVGAVLVPPALGYAIGSATDAQTGTVAGIVLFLAMFVAGIRGARLLIPRRIDEGYARYRGVCDAFLARLPPLPPSLRG